MDNPQEEKYCEYIRSLSHDRVTGLLDPEENAYLEQQLETNPKAVEIYNSVVEKYNSPKAQEFFNNPLSSMPSERLSELLATPRPRGGRRVVMVGLLTAAALVVFGFFIYMLVKGRTTHEKKFANQISLTTSEGKIIPIAGNKRIVTDNATLMAKDSSLTFTGGENVTAGVMNTLTVPAGQNYRITLSDGTLVWLNAESKLEFPFKFAGKREVTIRGEAYMEIAQDPQKPFIVHCPGGPSVEVLGTSFNVNSYEASEARISLISGSVRVLLGEDSLMLKPGYQAISKAGGIKETKFDAADELAWREGMFYFNSMALSEVVKVISRWYGLTVVVDDPQTASRIFTGSLDRSRPIEEFLENATDIIKISYYKKDGVLHIE